MTASPPTPPAGSGAPAAAPSAKPPLGRETASTLFWTVLMKRPDPLTSLAFTVPLFLFYHLGILQNAGDVERRSRADFVSILVFSVLEASRQTYVLTTLALTLVLLLAAWVQQKRVAVPVVSFGRVLGESA